ncbi:MAG TPA: hypothetical protein VFQ92_06480 [Blastocatellia bacterium]|nr:hypothetical protein [Blastocatellia bacterium]
MAGAVAALAMAALFSINSIAASASEPQAFTGRLTSAKGRVTINFAPAAEGATFSSGSTIITEGDGEATVEMGDLGRLQLRPNSNIKVMMTPSNVEVIMQYCSSITQTVPPEVAANVVTATPTVMQIAVSRGEVLVDRDEGNSKRGKAKIKAVKDKILEVSRSVSALEGDVTFTMNCCSCCFVEKRRQ